MLAEMRNMGSSIRKIERKAVVANRKHVQKALRDAESMLGRMRKNCSECNLPFDAKSPGALDTWRISIKGEFSMLTCPECWEKISSSPSVQQGSL
jgi:hypothetical protein